MIWFLIFDFQNFEVQKWCGSQLPTSLQLDWGLVWLPRSPPPRWSGSAVAGVRGWLVVVVGGGESRYVVSQGQAHPHFFPFLFFLHPVGIRFWQRFSLRSRFSCFPTHPLHVPSRIDRGELPGVAVFRPRLRLARLRLAAPGCLLGGTLGGLSAAAPGYRQPHR